MPRRHLDRNISLYLDLARISAAVIVLLHHTFRTPFYETVQIPGRSAVIVFFVISGFVIAYASDGQRDWREYTTARFARIYSVALPSVILTGVLYTVGQWAWPGASGEPMSLPWLRMLMSLVFTNQFWNLTVTPLTNSPYWSLCYEVWYYIIFGLVLFGRGAWRWLAPLVLMVIVGPRILLLMPVWMLGAMLYHLTKQRQTGRRPIDWILFALSVACFFVTLFAWNPADPISRLVAGHLHDGYWHVGGFAIFLGGDSAFLSDYFLGLTFALTVALSPASAQGSVQETAGAVLVRDAASYTFSLYLYHAPLLFFFHAALGDGIPHAARPWTLVALVVVSVWLLGRLTEHRKTPYANVCRRLLGASELQRSTAKG